MNVMNFFLLLQHVADKPIVTQITDNGTNPMLAIVVGVVGAMAGAVGSFIITRNVVRPNEKVEQYEAAEIKAIRDSFAEFKEAHRRDKAEWHIWRDITTKEITTLQLHQDNQSKLFSELKADVTQTRDIVQTIQLNLTKLSGNVERQLNSWGK